MRRVLIAGAGGRDFHTFNVVFRADPDTEVVAFTAAQIPNIDNRCYPPELAGPRYPNGIPIRPEAELEALVREHSVDDVVFAYSDVAYADVMHLASRAMAAGADFHLIGPRASSLHSRRPVVAVCATRTGCGKSQTSRVIARLLHEAGLRAALVRHPMPYGALNKMRVQRFGTLADIDASDPTVEEREEYEEPVRQGMVMFAGVDYADILAAAEGEADVIVWDGGNNDLPFYVPDLMIVVADALRPGHELAYHPGEVNVRLADIVVVNKVDTAESADVERELEVIHALNPTATVICATSPPVLAMGPEISGRRVLVVDDGPTLTHGGMPFGAGLVAARAAGGVIVDPRPYAVGSLATVYEKFPHLGPVLPAMGYGDQQLADLVATIAATPCDVVVTGTPIDLAATVRARLGDQAIGH
ncbi:MAG TPA: GTP-binding protein, partial [Ilumatobacteraceae bacterium]|nr:GTP-binding protein [Ilumatobacteraceae bacterium]